MSDLLKHITEMHPGLAWLLANVPPALTEPLRSNTQKVLENLIIKHGILQGSFVEHTVRDNDGLSLLFFGDAPTIEAMEDKFRQFMAETIVEEGEDDLIEELIDQGVRNLEAEGELIEDVAPSDLPPEDCWSASSSTM